MNIQQLLLLFFLFQYSIIIGYCQSDTDVNSIYQSYSAIENDFERLDSLKVFVHPKNGGDMWQSIKLLEMERSALGKVSKKPLQHVLLNNLLFKCYWSINEYQKGVSFLLEGKEIANKYRERNDEWENALAELYLETAFVYYFKQKPKKAFVNANRALNSYKKLGNNRKLAEAYWRLGIAKSQMGKSQEALAYYKDAEKIIDPKKEESNYLRVQYLKSIELTIQNRFEEARRVLKNILPKMKAANHTNYAVALAKMGQVETQIGNLIPAKKYLAEAEELKINTNDLNAKAMIAHRYEEYYLAIGQFQNAYDQLAIRKSIADSISRKRVQEETVAFQNRFNELSQQQQIKDLKYEQVIQESRFKSWLGILSGLFLAALSLLGLIGYKKEKNRMETSLIASKEAEVSEVRDHLCTSITNKLRTPLAFIMSQLDDLKNEPLSNHATLLVDSSQKSTSRLLHQVNQLMDLKQLEAETMTAKEVEGDLILFLKEYLARFKSSALGKDFIWKVDFEQESFLCKLDFEKLNAILTNLMSNAINYCPIGSEIKLTFSQKRDFVVIKIEDNGPGIEPAHQEDIFNWYYRAKNNSQDVASSSGVGLALSKELAELMKGTIALTSKVNEGSQIVLRIPFKKVDETNYTKVDNVILPIGNGKEGYVKSVVKDSLSKLLLVEDQLDLSKHIERILSNDYEVISFPTASAAESWAMENIPDLILTDLTLPDMSGFELSKSLKSNMLTDHIPIIVLNARADERDKHQNMEANVDAFLTKPFKAEELLISLNNLIEDRKEEREKFLRADADQEKIIQTNPFLVNFYKLLTENYSDHKFDVEVCANLMYISRMQLSKKTAVLINDTPSSIINKYRVKKSSELLEQSELSIDEIAYQCGFLSPEHFSTIYKEIHNQSPKKYRSTLS